MKEFNMKIMELNETPTFVPEVSQMQMIAEIHKFTKQTRNYMRWQMYITLVLVVLPLLASLFILPFAFKSLENSYIQPLEGIGSPSSGTGSQSVQGLLKGLQ